MNTSFRILVSFAVVAACLGLIVPEMMAGQMDLDSAAEAKFGKRSLFLFKGILLDIEAMPVAGARLTVIPSERNERQWETITDSDGRFLVVSERVQEAAFFCAAEGYKPFQTRPRSANGRLIEIIVSKLFRLSGMVIDAETRAPIDAFRIIPGESYGSKLPVAWYRNSEQLGKAGGYTFVADRKGGLISIAIEADQYLPANSTPFQAPGWHDFDFELKRGIGLAGRVTTPKGAPAAEARLVLAAMFQNVVLDESGRLESDQPGFAVSDSKGGFQFGARFEPETIFATHEQGFVRLPSEDLVNGGIVRLEAWGGVKGVVRGEMPPELRRSVTLRTTAAQSKLSPRGSPRISLSIATHPGPDNEFVFDRVPPGEYELRLSYEFARGGEAMLARRSLVQVVPGEITTSEIGGEGRRIEGQISVFGEDPGVFDWLQAESTFGGKQTGLNPGSEAELEFPVILQRNGSFEIPDVPPGVYELSVSLRSPPGEPGQIMVLGTLEKEITVSEQTGERAKEPMDIGTLRLEVKKKGAAAPIAPVF